MSISRSFKSTKTNIGVSGSPIPFKATTLPTKGSSLQSDRLLYVKDGNRVNLSFSYSHTASGSDGSGVYTIELPYRPAFEGFYGTGVLFTTTLSGTVPLVLIASRTNNDLELRPVGSGGGSGCNFLEDFAASGAFFDEDILSLSGSIEYLTDE